MLDLSPTKLIIIFVVVIVLLGPKRLPQVARQLGAGWRKIVGFQQTIERELRETMPDLPSSQDIVRFARSPVSMLNHLAEFPGSTAEAPVQDPGAPAPGSALAMEDGSDPATGGDPTGDAADESADGPGHWPEDPGSGTPAGAAGVTAPSPAGRPSPHRRTLADLGALAADDPAMN